MADSFDIAAKHNFQDCSARGISSAKCAQEEVAALQHVFKPAKGESAAFTLCTMWEKFKALIGG